jgi:hypothetical protein
VPVIRIVPIKVIHLDLAAALSIFLTGLQGFDPQTAQIT